MKRSIRVLPCLLSVLLAAVPMAAAENVMTNTEQGMTGTTVVRLVIPAVYTVEIPASLDIAYGAEATPLTIGVSSMNVGSDKAVKIAVDSASGSLLQEGGSGAIPFALRREGEAFAGEVYTGAGQTQLSVDIALVDWFNAAAGEYGGAVTFRVSVEDREVAQ